ncbi:ABC transporter permease [Peptostreptococcaceae bacterium AGR-M142]
MRISELFKNVMINILENKFRSILTTLGIIVGCATIILVFGIGEQSKKEVEDRFSFINAKTLTISVDRDSNESFTKEDKNYLDEYSDYKEQVELVLSSSKQISYMNDGLSQSVKGVNNPYFEISNLILESGRLFEEDDKNLNKKVAIIGSDVKDELFEGVDPISKIITIDGIKFEIVGVLESRGSRLDDPVVYLPYEIAKSYVIGKNSSPELIISAKSINDMDKLKNEVLGLLKIRYDDEFYNIRDLGSIVETAKESASAMSLLLASIGAIVLIVGGIGIMNVLFVSVKERTKEIGTLKALGTTKRDILLQFLIESIIISLIGGILGVILSFILVPAFEMFEMKMIITYKAYVIALLFAVLTGSVFGYYPAYKASDLPIIDALRYE